MTGISARPGILIGDSENWLVFRLPGVSFMTVPYRKVVRPSASTFKTTPTMIWSTPHLTENRASSAPRAAPARGAAMTPA